MKKTTRNRLPAMTHKKRDESSRKQTKGNGCLFVNSGLNSPNFCFVAHLFMAMAVSGHQKSASTGTQRNNQHNGTQRNNRVKIHVILFLVVDVSLVAVPVFCCEITISIAGSKTFYTIRFWHS
jgi:hypothetical protein